MLIRFDLKLPCLVLGGEEPVFFDEVDRVDPGGAGQGGLANYFTSTLESSFISRRGRPPVIRAAEKVQGDQKTYSKTGYRYKN